MFEVTVQDTFSSGHYLRNYKGKCENPHGHNYRVRVTLQGAELDHAGLLLDFKDLKLVMKPVIEYLDHKMINDIEPFTVLNPTAENIAKYFLRRVQPRPASGHRRPGQRQAGHHLGDRHLHRHLLRVVGMDMGAPYLPSFGRCGRAESRHLRDFDP